MIAASDRADINLALAVARPDAVAHRPSLQPVDDNDLVSLQKLLDTAPSRSDPYSRSASYFAMTGRKGLWLYSTDDTFMLIAAHPNRDNHLLLFPPIGKQPATLLSQIVRDDRIFAKDVQLARMGGQDQLLLAWAEASGLFEADGEKLLDWQYPVHILATNELAEHKGTRFRDFRKNILRAERDHLSARLVEGRKDMGTLSSLVGIWAKSNGHDGYSINDLTSPARRIIQLMEANDLPLHGLIVDRGNEPVGFIAWEETHPEQGLANSMANVSVNGHGVSEFSYKAMAQVLAKRGFAKVCIGGSETAGLDQFKRKMQPVHSTPLQSAYAIQRSHPA